MNPAAYKIKEWREDPVQFVRDNFQVEPDIWQKEFLMALGGPEAQRRRVAAKACTGPGKSAGLAWAGWQRLSCFCDPGEHPKGAALSGEGRDNLADNLWSELSKWQQRSQFLMAAFQWNKSQITNRKHSETWFLSARSYPKDADEASIGSSLSGLHSRYPFVLLDETGNMPIAVGQKATQIFTGGTVDGLIAAAGNPTSVTGLLYHISVAEREQWIVITITADPDDPKRTPRVDIEHAREQIKLHGRNDPWVMATILGEFPPGGFNSLLSINDVEAAMNRHYQEPEYEYAQKRLGVDVARFGDDRTIIFPRQGLVAFKPVEMRGARSHEIAARIAVAKSKWKSELELVDDTGGFGSGVIDSLLQAGHAPLGISFASGATDIRFLNKRAEMHWNLAEWVKRGGCLPKVPGLIKELTAPTYTFNKGKIQIEEKDQIKVRIKQSPDMADALCLTFALPDMPAALPYPQNLLSRTRDNRPATHHYEYDVFDPKRN